MSFKTHLLIVSVIILAVYLAWSVTRSKPAAPTEQAVVKTAYNIAVTHASWGLNCPRYSESTSTLDKAYVKKTDAHPQYMKKDNALEIVSELCNGKLKCTVPVSDETFPDMAPEDCGEKKLEVEYRCYAFDRPWFARATGGMLTLTCEDKNP
jgi:hypothetical protein